MNADNPVQCGFSFLGCWSRFQNFKHWKDHMQTMHLDYKYACPTCSYETGWIGNLRMHIFRRQDTHPSCSMSILNDAFRSSLPTELQCHQKNCEEVFKGTSAWHRWASHAWVHIQENQYQDLNFRSSLGRRQTVIACQNCQYMNIEVKCPRFEQILGHPTGVLAP